jgi:hypothetical protein
MWSDLWDEMQSAGVHPESERFQPSPFAADVLSTTAQDTYYDYFDSEPELLQEEKIPNPVYPDSIGADQDGPKPAWVNENLLKEIESLKKRLFAVENRVARMGQGKKWSEKPVNGDDKGLMSEIQSLRKRLDKVSNQLGIKDEFLPWQIKRD